MSEIFTVMMPDIGEGVAEGEVIEWLKKVNDNVGQDEPIVVMMTDKATVELPAPYPGVLVKQYHKVGEMASKGRPLYDLQLSATDAAASKKHVRKAVPQHPCKKPEGSKNTTSSIDSQDGGQAKINGTIEGQKTSAVSAKISDTIPSQTPFQLQPATAPALQLQRSLATPAMRKLARDLDIDINQVSGSGKDGRITVEDIKNYIAGQALPQQGRANTVSAAPQDNGQVSKRAFPAIQSSTPLLKLEGDEEVPILGLRNIIAEKMVESKLLIPHFSYSDQLDATRLMQLRDNMKAEALKSGIKLTYMPFFIRALSLALKKYPQMNGSVEVSGKKMVIHKQQNMGLAMKTPTGLMAPVLQRVETMSLSDIIRAFDALKVKAMDGQLAPSDMKNSTITVSNFGTLGGMWATPIINYPEIAILGIAKIRPQPVVKNDALVVRPMLNLSWSFDHRVVDGDSAAEFSNAFITLLENPASLL